MSDTPEPPAQEEMKRAGTDPLRECDGCCGSGFHGGDAGRRLPCAVCEGHGLVSVKPQLEIVAWYVERTPLPRVGDLLRMPDGRDGRVLTAKPTDDLRGTKLTLRTWAALA